jgi:hypothetical protein
MDCPSCGTAIPPNERFCRNCGREALALDKTLLAPPPTVAYRPANQTDSQRTEQQLQTANINLPNPSFPLPASRPREERSRLFVPLVVTSIVLALAALGTLAYFLWLGNKADSDASNTTLPDHFGIFLRNRDALDELRRRDYTDAGQARDALMKEGSLPTAVAQPVLILYSEPQDIPVSDLKLVELNSINQNGQLRHWSYQVAPVEGRSNMKQLRVAGGLPAGRYAFALLNGYSNEGNHKFWPFEVVEGTSQPADSPQVTTLPVKTLTASTKPTPTTEATPKPTPNTEPPPGAQPAYCNDTNVFVRNAPNLTARPVTKITRGQKLWVLGTSSNYSNWNGVNANWTQVQLDKSTVRGWVFSPFVSYK